MTGTFASLGTFRKKEDQNNPETILDFPAVCGGRWFIAGSR
jgi:hypothetical protein